MRIRLQYLISNYKHRIKTVTDGNRSIESAVGDNSLNFIRRPIQRNVAFYRHSHCKAYSNDLWVLYYVFIFRRFEWFMRYANLVDVSDALPREKLTRPTVNNHQSYVLFHSLLFIYSTNGHVINEPTTQHVGWIPIQPTNDVWVNNIYGLISVLWNANMYHILYHLPALRWHWQLNLLCIKDEELFILHNKTMVFLLRHVF